MLEICTGYYRHIIDIYKGQIVIPAQEVQGSLMKDLPQLSVTGQACGRTRGRESRAFCRGEQEQLHGICEEIHHWDVYVG